MCASKLGEKILCLIRKNHLNLLHAIPQKKDRSGSANPMHGKKKSEKTLASAPPMHSSFAAIVFFAIYFAFILPVC
jgi:hypothetical protein